MWSPRVEALGFAHYSCRCCFFFEVFVSVQHVSRLYVSHPEKLSLSRGLLWARSDAHTLYFVTHLGLTRVGGGCRLRRGAWGGALGPGA